MLTGLLVASTGQVHDPLLRARDGGAARPTSEPIAVLDA